MERLKQLSGRDILLAVAVVVAAIGLLVVYKQSSNASSKTGQLKTEVASARAALQALEFGQQQAALQRQIADLQKQLNTSNQLPSRAEALGLTSAIAATASKNNVIVTGFDSTAAQYADSSGQHPAIAYTIDAAGPPAALVDTLDTATSMTSSIVQNLKFGSATSSTSSWTMHTQLLIVYSATGTSSP